MLAGARVSLTKMKREHTQWSSIMNHAGYTQPLHPHVSDLGISLRGNE